MRQLRDADGKLKRLVADLTLDRHILQEALGKVVKPAGKRSVARWAEQAFQLSERRADDLRFRV